MIFVSFEDRRLVVVTVLRDCVGGDLFDFCTLNQQDILDITEILMLFVVLIVTGYILYFTKPEAGTTTRI